MVVAQAVAVAFLGAGATVTARSSCGGENGGISCPRAQNPGSARPRTLVSSLHRRNFKACLGLQSIPCASSVNGVPAADDGHANNAGKLDFTYSVEEEQELKYAKDAPGKPTVEASGSAFMADVANLVKLVNSRDIVELELKHKEYEIVIRKDIKQPEPPPMTFPGPHVMAHTSFPAYGPPPPPPPPLSAPPDAVAAEPTPVSAAVPVVPAKLSHPPMLSPMAGTFYRSPAPGEAAFVQVGDKVTKGQVVCIVEAMKLMNEIEADRSGTIVEILAEDAKPVSIESPLYAII